MNPTEHSFKRNQDGACTAFHSSVYRLEILLYLISVSFPSRVMLFFLQYPSIPSCVRSSNHAWKQGAESLNSYVETVQLANNENCRLGAYMVLIPLSDLTPQHSSQARRHSRLSGCFTPRQLTHYIYFQPP